MDMRLHATNQHRLIALLCVHMGLLFQWLLSFRLFLLRLLIL